MPAPNGEATPAMRLQILSTDLRTTTRVIWCASCPRRGRADLSLRGIAAHLYARATLAKAQAGQRALFPTPTADR